MAENWFIRFALIIGFTGVALAGSVARLSDTTEEKDDPSGTSEQQRARFLERRAAELEANTTSGKKLVCYYDNKAAIRPAKGQLKVNDIDPFLCTHLIYGPLSLDGNGKIVPILHMVDTNTSKSGQNMLGKLSSLKRLNPELKILLGVFDRGSKFSPVASSAVKRANFVKSALDYLAKYDLDGLDLTWKYPNEKANTEDRENYVQLARNLSAAFKSKPPDIARNYLLSASVIVFERRVQLGIDFSGLSRELDFINLMSYDYNGGWDDETGLHAPLYPSDQFDRNETDRQLNIEWSVKFILDQGADPAKLMLGITTYGRSFNLLDETSNGINAPLNGPAKPGPYRKDDKLLAYNEMCESMTRDPVGWQIVRDDSYKAPYAFKGTLWVSFENEWSAELKVKFANDYGLGGVAIVSLDMDDFLGECASSNMTKYPITTTVKRGLGIIRGGGNAPQTEPAATGGGGGGSRNETERSGNGSPATPDIEATSTPNPSGAGTPGTAEGGEGGREGGGGEGGQKEPLPVCGAGGQWYFPAPECSDYYDCTSGTAKLTHCREGLLWKQSKFWCDFPNNIGDECKNNKPVVESP